MHHRHALRPSDAGPGREQRRSGFTLIELLIAVTLMTVLIVAAGYIFDTAAQAINHTQANGEMLISETAFSAALRGDMERIEPDGFLVTGRRQIAPEDVPGGAVLGGISDRARGMSHTFRTDWLWFLTAGEASSKVDARFVGTMARVFYGHADVTNLNDSDFSPLVTNWVLLRLEAVVIPETPDLDPNTIESSETYDSRPDARAQECFVEGRGGLGAAPTYLLNSYQTRKLQWYSPVYGQPKHYEPEMFGPGTSRGDKAWYVLPHCGNFEVQYAMGDELAAGPGGGPLWRDPPAVGENKYDPNYDAADPDKPSHEQANLTDGRLVFGPGDRWPAMLRVTASVYDPLGRFEAPRTVTTIVRLP